MVYRLDHFANGRHHRLPSVDLNTVQSYLAIGLRGLTTLNDKNVRTPIAPGKLSIRISFFVCLLVLGLIEARAQVYSNKPKLRINPQQKDSIAARDYPFSLPILGKKAFKAGYDLPYSAGLGINYLWQKSDLIINNLTIGFNGGPTYNLNEVVRFDNATSEASGVNIRPDIWLFPFLNVYGIVAQSKPSTAVGFGIFVPDQTGTWNRVATFNTKANFQATTLGFGLTPTIGVRGIWIALDMNFTWNDVPQLSRPAFAYVVGPRFGKSLKLRKPESSVAFWVGGFRLALNSGTSGNLPLNQLISTDGLQAKVDAGIQTVENVQTQVDNWWNGLTPIEQKNPLNVAKYETANRVIDTSSQFLGQLDNALNDTKHATVQYSLDKRPKDMWNFIVGSQYQYNKHFMLRAEYGFLGSRTQLIAGLQYRFGL
jgi:hypothetical protein